MIEIVRKLTVVALLVLALTNAGAWERLPGDLNHTNLFGVRTGEPITNGFLFINGKYIDAPYVFEEYGVAVRVNGEHLETVIFDNRLFPPAAVTKDPGLPDTITRDTNWYKTIRLANGRKKYLKSRYMGVEYVREYEHFLRGLPSVAKVELIKEYAIGPFAGFRVHTHNGEVNTITIPRNNRGLHKAPTRESMLKKMEHARKIMEQRLNRDSFVFAGNRSTLRMCSGWVLGPQHDVLRVFKSSLSVEEKVRRLQALKFFPDNYHAGMIDSAGYGPLLREFKGSPQLEARLRGEPVNMTLPARPKVKPAITNTEEVVATVALSKKEPAIAPAPRQMPSAASPVPGKAKASTRNHIAVIGLVILCLGGIVVAGLWLRRKF